MTKDAPTNPAPGPQSTKSLVPGSTKVDGKTDEAPKNPASDNTPEEQKPTELTKAEEAKLQKLLGDDDESGEKWPDDDKVPEHMRDSFAAAKKFQKLAAVVPADTPDDHTIWGAGGVTITVGDLRAIVKTMPTA